jgi:hypothetical protein
MSTHSILTTIDNTQLTCSSKNTSVTKRDLIVDSDERPLSSPPQAKDNAEIKLLGGGKHKHKKESKHSKDPKKKKSKKKHHSKDGRSKSHSEHKSIADIVIESREPNLATT